MDIEKNSRTKKKDNKSNIQNNDQYDEYDAGRGLKKEKRRSRRHGDKQFLKKYSDDIDYMDNFEKR